MFDTPPKIFNNIPINMYQKFLFDCVTSQFILGKFSFGCVRSMPTCSLKPAIDRLRTLPVGKIATGTWKGKAAMDVYKTLAECSPAHDKELSWSCDLGNI